MRKFAVLYCCLLIAVFALYRPVPALAVAAPGTAVTGTCGVLDDTCAASDATFVPTSVKVSVSSAGITTVTCSGTTTKKPTKATKCDGETLGGTSGETAPLQPCSITLGTKAVTVDDWLEVISPSGNVKLICKAGGTETK
jgi:hypothetical protein